MTLQIREDGRIEWTCKHGIGHTIAIPYHLVLLVSRHDSPLKRRDEQDAHFSHGCDGCCAAGKMK